MHAFDPGKRVKPLAREPFGHQRKESVHGGLRSELVE
jgi:hypothetical protein